MKETLSNRNKDASARESGAIVLFLYFVLYYFILFCRLGRYTLGLYAPERANVIRRNSFVWRALPQCHQRISLILELRWCEIIFLFLFFLFYF
jgi:hypothetical protein